MYAGVCNEDSDCDNDNYRPLIYSNTIEKNEDDDDDDADDDIDNAK